MLGADAYACLKSQIKRHEGFRSRAYRDTVGVWTIGWGHTKGVKEGDRVGPQEAESWLDYDIGLAEGIVFNLYQRHLEKLSETRRAVLVNMAFNLGGPRLRRFVGLERAIWAQDWREASAEMVDSVWAGQVGRRAYELAYQMRADRWW